MSLPSRLAELIGVGTRALGKGLAAAGSQAVKNMKYKPEGMDRPQQSSSGRGGNEITKGNMSIEEAQLILNVKEGESMEAIRRQYDRIFAANSPPKEPEPQPGTSASAARARSKAPQHSHYLQSKVYRALERIKEERGDFDEPPPSAEASQAPEAGGAGAGENTRTGAAGGAGTKGSGETQR